MNIVARIAATMATNEASSVEDCQMVAIIPRIVPIAPGPHTHDFHATWRCVAASFACNNVRYTGRTSKGL